MGVPQARVYKIGDVAAKTGVSITEIIQGERDLFRHWDSSSVKCGCGEEVGSFVNWTGCQKLKRQPQMSARFVFVPQVALDLFEIWVYVKEHTGMPGLALPDRPLHVQRQGHSEEHSQEWLCHTCGQLRRSG